MLCRGRVLVYFSKCISGSNTLHLNMVVMPYIVYFVASMLAMLLLADFRMENITHRVILIADNDKFKTFAFVCRSAHLVARVECF